MANSNGESRPRDPAREGALALEEKLAQVAEFEAQVRPGVMAAILRTAGKSPAFAWSYRRIGPVIDTWLGRSFGGWVNKNVYGMPALLLVTTGKKSGLPRTSPLLYVRDGRDFLVVGTNFGQAHHPAWTGNLAARPVAEVMVGPVTLAVEARQLDEAEFRAMWPRFVDVYPGYEGYVQRSGRTPRMFRLAPRP